MKITSKGMELLDSKCFVTYGRGETRIDISYQTDSLTLILELVCDDTKQEKHSFQIINTQTLKLLLTNWDRPLGLGFVNPIEVGSIGNRILYLCLWVRKAGDKSDCHEITVSFYLGEIISNG